MEVVKKKLPIFHLECTHASRYVMTRSPPVVYKNCLSRKDLTSSQQLFFSKSLLPPLSEIIFAVVEEEEDFWKFMQCTNSERNMDDYDVFGIILSALVSK